jgi:glucosamine kinase
LALRAYDKRAVETSLTRDVMMRFHNDPFEAVAWMDHATATDYAIFAPLVMRHADAGDPVARRIIRDAAEQIDELVRRLSDCGASRVALLGGLASSMQPWLAPDVQRRLVPVEGDAVDGALHLARRAVMKG